jgi:hypothetical protein
LNPLAFKRSRVAVVSLMFVYVFSGMVKYLSLFYLNLVS